MNLHGLLGRPELRPYLLVEQARDDQAEDVALPGGEGLEPAPEQRALRAVGAPLAVLLETASHRFQERLVREGFLQEIDGPPLHGADAALDVGPAADEDDRKVESLLEEDLLEVEPAQAGHSQVDTRQEGMSSGSAVARKASAVGKASAG